VPSILFGTGAYQRTNGNLPPLTLINMFVEQAKTSEKQIALLSRKGLATSVTRGSGPINGIYSRPGLYSGAIFTISGSTLYKDGTSLGTIGGTGRSLGRRATPSWSLLAGVRPTATTAPTLPRSSFPDSANVKAVAFIGSLFVFVRSGSGKFYWSAPLDGRTVDALDFATAEREGDQLLDLATVGDNLLLLGQDSTELWEHTGRDGPAIYAVRASGSRQGHPLDRGQGARPTTPSLRWAIIARSIAGARFGSGFRITASKRG
jgi:hypothetical protein